MKKKKLTPEEQAELNRLIVSANASLDQADAAAKAQGQCIARLNAKFDQMMAMAKAKAAELKANKGLEALVDKMAALEDLDVGFFAMVGILAATIPEMKPIPRLRRGK